MTTRTIRSAGTILAGYNVIGYRNSGDPIILEHMPIGAADPADIEGRARALCFEYMTHEGDWLMDSAAGDDHPYSLFSGHRHSDFYRFAVEPAYETIWREVANDDD